MCKALIAIAKHSVRHSTCGFASKYIFIFFFPYFYLGIVQDGMIVNSWEKHFHHVRLVIQRRSAKRLQICRQVCHICLEFGKGCKKKKELGEWEKKKKIVNLDIQFT